MSDPQVLYPRAVVVIGAIVDGEEIKTLVTPHRLTIHFGTNTKATEATLEIEGTAIPFDIRSVESIDIAAFVGLADQVDGSVRSSSNLRFYGYADEDEIDYGEQVIHLRARDLSALLREHEPLLPKVVNGKKVDPTPRYSDTLKDAINRILSVVPGFGDSSKKPPLELRDTDALSTASLGTLVEGKFQNGPISLKPKTSAWAAIEEVCGLASRLVSVELGEIVVRYPKDVFVDPDRNDQAAYTFEFGTENANSFGPSMHKKYIINRKGIRVVGWNPLTRKRVEGVWPSDSAIPPRRRPKVKTHKPGAQSHTKRVQSQPPPDRETFSLGSGAFTKDALTEYAKRLWLERSTQELDGHIATPIWDADDKVLGLRNGDRIKVTVNPELEATLRTIDDDTKAAQFLVDNLEISQDVANALVRAAKKPHDDLYVVVEHTIDWPSDKLSTIRFASLLRVKE